MDTNNRNRVEPPPGYPRVDQQEGGKKKNKCCGRRRSSKRVKGSFIEGCIAALCCCWLCELCCD